jgi:hypothetical protein
MDYIFFQKHLLTIARYTHSRILFRKERLYYYKFVRKLSYHIRYLDDKNVTKAIAYVGIFEDRQERRIRNGFFIKPRKVLRLACQDVKDVLESMKRFEGTDAENWVPFRVFPEVNFR